MSRLYLVRHGQAGTRHDYDCLSELGVRQSRLLGEYFAAQKIQFAAAISGGLARQRETASVVKSGYESAGVRFPEIAIEEEWNEFDLDDVYRALAPRLCSDDAEFRAEYEALVKEAHDARHEADAAVHRRWMPADVKVLKAWLTAAYAYEGESWLAFRERVIGFRSRLPDFGRDANLIVFTSATPIGIWAAMSLDVNDERSTRLAGVLHNSSYTVMRAAEGELRLHCFNSVPHLDRPELRTYR